MVERACERTGGRAALCARGRLCGWGGDLEWNGWLGGRWERVRTGRVGGAVVVVVGYIGAGVDEVIFSARQLREFSCDLDWSNGYPPPIQNCCCFATCNRQHALQNKQTRSF